MKFKQAFGKLMLKLTGFKIIGDIPTDPKYVLVIAPHTSIADMFMGKFYNWTIGMKPKVMVAKKFFFFPVGSIIRTWGAVPIDRSKGKTVVEQMVKFFNENENFILGITPEGTRKRTVNWKSGFHRIATAAKVPVYMSVIDFKTKTLGVFGKFETTNDVKEDIKALKKLYRDAEGYHKEKFTTDNN